MKTIISAVAFILFGVGVVVAAEPDYRKFIDKYCEIAIAYVGTEHSLGSLKNMYISSVNGYVWGLSEEEKRGLTKEQQALFKKRRMYWAVEFSYLQQAPGGGIYVYIDGIDDSIVLSYRTK